MNFCLVFIIQTELSVSVNSSLYFSGPPSGSIKSENGGPFLYMRQSTFLKSQEIYLDFISQRALSGRSQAEYCRNRHILPMTLSTVLAAAEQSADFTRPFPGSDHLPAASIQASSRRFFSPESVEFAEVKLW